MLITDMTPKQLRELADELEERQKINNVPKPLAAPNFSKVINLTEQMIAEMAIGQDDEDNAQFLYEEVMQAIYGEDVFDWINKQLY